MVLGRGRTAEHDRHDHGEHDVSLQQLRVERNLTVAHGNVLEMPVSGSCRVRRPPSLLQVSSASRRNGMESSAKLSDRDG
jgi:hypothetical protein